MQFVSKDTTISEGEGSLRTPPFTMKEIVLHERVTLDDAVLSASTFPNGCDWAFYFEADGSVRMGYGCFGVLINLIHGKRKLLYNWFVNNRQGVGDGAKAVLPISEETKAKLKTREPCKICGQPYFKAYK